MLRQASLCGLAWIILSGWPASSYAQHSDVLVVQVEGQLATGTADCTSPNCETGMWSLGQRAFFWEFDEDWAVNNPGFNALGTGFPDGSQSLPGDTSLAWDFVPMRIDDHPANLFYWDGAETDGSPGLTPEDVQFGPLPGPSYTLSLYDKSSVGHSVDGNDAAVPGGVIDDTAADGALHRHRFFFLEDGDGNAGTQPADGIYLLSTRLRMDGLSSSLPIYFVFGTIGSSVAALDDAAVPWVTANEETLVLLGDYNRDGEVSAGDYTVWRNSLGESGFALAADGNWSGHVDRGDYFVWRDNYGKSSPVNGSGSAQSAAATVPEPTSRLLFLIALASWALEMRRGRIC